jgi:MFS family permease
MNLAAAPAFQNGESAMSPLRQALMIAVLLIFCIFAVLDRNLMAMLIDPIKLSLGISDTQIALLLGFAYALAYGLGGLPMGSLVDRYPRKWILFCAVIFWGMAEAACGMASGFLSLFIARALVGLGESPLHPSSHSIIADTVPRNRLSFVMSIYSTGNVVGTGISLALGGWIVHRLFSQGAMSVPILGHVEPWQFAFIITGIPGLLLAFLIVPFREPPRRATGMSREQAAKWSELWGFFRRNWQASLCLAVVFGGMNIANGAFLKWMPAYLSRFFKLNPAEYGTMLGTVEVVSGVCGLLLSGWLIDRWYASGRKDAHLTYYLWVLILTTPLVLWCMLTPSVAMALIGVGIAKGITVNFLGLAAAQIQMIAPPHLRGRLSGFFFLMVLSLFGSTFGSLLPALFSDHVFHDNVNVGRSIAATLAIFAPIAIIAILWGRRHVLAAIKSVEADGKSWS